MEYEVSQIDKHALVYSALEVGEVLFMLGISNIIQRLYLFVSLSSLNYLLRHRCRRHGKPLDLESFELSFPIFVLQPSDCICPAWLGRWTSNRSFFLVPEYVLPRGLKLSTLTEADHPTTCP